MDFSLLISNRLNGQDFYKNSYYKFKLYVKKKIKMRLRREKYGKL